MLFYYLDNHICGHPKNEQFPPFSISYSFLPYPGQFNFMVFSHYTFVKYLFILNIQKCEDNSFKKSSPSILQRGLTLESVKGMMSIKADLSVTSRIMPKHRPYLLLVTRTYPSLPTEKQGLITVIRLGAIFRF